VSALVKLVGKACLKARQHGLIIAPCT
jgi:hypothetical protein